MARNTSAAAMPMARPIARIAATESIASTFNTAATSRW
jgi:hypothetical protein